LKVSGYSFGYSQKIINSKNANIGPRFKITTKTHKLRLLYFARRSMLKILSEINVLKRLMVFASLRILFLQFPKKTSATLLKLDNFETTGIML